MVFSWTPCVINMEIWESRRSWNRIFNPALPAILLKA